MNLSRDHIFPWIAKISCAHFRQLILGALILAILAAFLITRLPFQSDVLNLLPGKAPQTGDFVKFLREFGSADSLFIVLERADGGEVESFEPFAEFLADRLMATGEFTEIIGHITPEEKMKMGQVFLRRALLYLSEEDLKALEAKLSDEGIEEQVRFLKRRVASIFTSPLVTYDPLELLPIFRKNLPVGASVGEMDSSGYFISADRKMILLIGKPRGSAPDINYDERLVQKIKAAELSAREAFAQKKGSPASVLLKDLKIGLTGGFIHALEDSRMIRKDLLLNFSNSLIGILLLVVLAFRSGISLFYAFFPLLISPLLTLGLFYPFLGRLSEATGAFSAIILGLSIDFIILLYARYLEEKKALLDVPGALKKSLITVGPGVFTGAVTTTAAYYALLFSDFRGVRELGLLTGTGILVSLGCAFFLFPALVVWGERKRPTNLSRRTLSSFFGLERLGVVSLNHPLMVIISCAAVSLGLLIGAFQVKLNNDPKSLRPQGHASLALEMRVQEKMEEGLETIIVLGETRGPEEALEVQGKWREGFEKGRSSGLLISRFETLADFIPPLSRQKRNLEWINSRGKEAFAPDRVARKLREELHREGLRLEPFDPGLKALREMMGSRELLTWEQIEASSLKTIAERFLKKKGDAFLSVAYLHIRPNFWSDPGAKEFLDNLKKSAPGTRVTGSHLVQKELDGLMTDESWKILLLALAAVSLLIYLDFRSWPLTFISMLPVVLASLWTLGLMGILKIELNFMNLVVFTMVLGIGVDYGVHILHRGLQSTPGQFAADLEQASKGVLLAGLTTLWGFGSLIFSSYPGLQSMGAVALLGVGFSLLTALTLVAVLLQKRLQKKRPF